MTFNQDFPGLKNRIFPCQIGDPSDVVSINDVECECLDKQNVFNALKDLRAELVTAKDGIDCSEAFNKCYERLGL